MANTNPRGTSNSSLFGNRFSNASFLSLSSVKTLLPHYSVVDTLEIPPTSSSEVTTGNCEPRSYSSPSSNSPPTIEPPRYSLLHPRVLTWRASTVTFEVEGDPPAQEFRYLYPIRSKNPWATLHLHTPRVAVPGIHSKSLQNQPRVPRFWSCDPVTGTVQLDLDSPQNIQQITITLNGSIVLPSHSGGSLPFLSREFTVWNNSMGDPLQYDRLIPGQHIFPFSFPFPSQTDPITKSSVLDTNSISPFRPHTVSTTPSTVASPTSPSDDRGFGISEKPQKRWTRRFTSVSDESPSSSKKSQMSGYPRTSIGLEPSRSLVSAMPQTFMEKGIDSSVAYGISVRIVHGRFKTSSKIKTDIVYLPASEPLPVSQKRREAYEAGALLPCPMDDPEGWFALPTVKTYGMVKIDDKLLHTRVDCTLYIAQPLTYTRGSHIPCFITIHSDGAEVEHLASTNRPTVRLLRRVWHPVADQGDPPPGAYMVGSSASISFSTFIMAPTSEMVLVPHEVGHADWWIPSKDIVQDPNSSHLEGEIHLNPDLQPSCDSRLFRIEYAVELLSFQTANFTPEVHPSSPRIIRKGDSVIASSPVEITTLYRQDEPLPTAYSKPPTAYHRRRVLSDKSTMI